MSPGLRYVRERAGDGAGRPILDADNGEELMHVETQVGIALGDNAPQSPGTLYITNKRLVWLNDVDRENGYAVDFLSIALHAISRDPAAYPFPCIYAQIETETIDDEEEELAISDVECNGSTDLSRISEMRLVPSDPSQLDILFEIFCDCAELNPDPNEEQDEEDSWVFGDELGGDGFEGENPHWNSSEQLENTIGYSNGVRDHDLAHTILELQIDDRRFEDADEMESGAHHEHE
ncbi:chloride conductance regulatory protein ICln [Nymphaea colorata]|nr:chloride conductance regulatory protein ICln [Nymphaea colorata]